MNLDEIFKEYKKGNLHKFSSELYKYMETGQGVPGNPDVATNGINAAKASKNRKCTCLPGKCNCKKVKV